MAQRDETQVDKEVVAQEVRVEASPETIFEFFVDPEKMTRWKGRSAQLDAKPGGIYRVEIGDEIIARGEYIEIDRPRRVLFTWGWEGGRNPVSPGSSTVEITLIPDGDGTIVRLEHRGIADPEQRAQHAHGWNRYLGRLQIAAAGGDPGPDEVPLPPQS